MTTISYIDPFITIADRPAQEEKPMLTLCDINKLTNSHDGDIFSDLFKDVCGYRPRGTLAQFESIEAFDAEFKRLAKSLDAQIEEEAQAKELAKAKFELRLSEIMVAVSNVDRANAIRLLAQAEGYEEDLDWYGYEKVEYEFNLPYGYIKTTLN